MTSERKLITAACACQSCVNRREEQIISIYNGKILYFCNDNCKKEFLADPEDFLKSDHFKIIFEDLEDAQ